MRCFLVNLVSFCPTFYIRDVKQPGLFLKAQGFGVQEIYSSRFENVENVNFEEEKPITWRCDVVRISEVSQPKLPLIKLEGLRTSFEETTNQLSMKRGS